MAANSGGDLTVGNCGRIIAYSSALGLVANGTTIFFSQPLASYNLFQDNPTLLRDGVHPTDIGDQTMGGLWAGNVSIDLGWGGTTLAGYSRSRVIGLG
jgi:hypothetical protein